MPGMFRPDQKAAGESGSVHPELYRWLRDLLDEATLSPTPTKTAAYSAVPGELVVCNPTGGGFTVTLPPANINDGLEIIVKNNSASANAIVVAGQGSDKIDGLGSQSIAAGRGWFAMRRNGTNWMITGSG